MATIEDFIEITITDEISTISQWMAERRLLYEYPHHGTSFVKYDERHIPVIKKGIIGEFLTFDYLHTKLNEKFGGLTPSQRWKAVEDRLCLHNQIGCFDKGYDLTIKDKSIDVKTYHDGILTKDEMIRYNLFVNVNEARNKPQADFYIQAFFTPDNTIVLAGCHRGLPEFINKKIKEPAHACLVRDLMPIGILVELLLEEQ